MSQDKTTEGEAVSNNTRFSISFTHCPWLRTQVPPPPCLIKLCIDALCRIPSLCWLLIQSPTGLLHLAVELKAATPLGWHGSLFFLCTEPSPCGSSDEIVSAYAYRKSRDFVNKPTCGIPRKTAQQDYTEIFSLSISIKIFEQKNSVYSIGSSQGLFIYLQRNIEVLILVEEKGPGISPLGQQFHPSTWVETQSWHYITKRNWQGDIFPSNTSSHWEQTALPALMLQTTAIVKQLLMPNRLVRLLLRTNNLFQECMD